MAYETVSASPASQFPEGRSLAPRPRWLARDYQAILLPLLSIFLPMFGRFDAVCTAVQPLPVFPGSHLPKKIGVGAPSSTTVDKSLSGSPAILAAIYILPSSPSLLFQPFDQPRRTVWKRSDRIISPAASQSLCCISPVTLDYHPATGVSPSRVIRPRFTDQGSGIHEIRRVLCPSWRHPHRINQWGRHTTGESDDGNTTFFPCTSQA